MRPNSLLLRAEYEAVTHVVRRPDTRLQLDARGGPAMHGTDLPVAAAEHRIAQALGAVGPLRHVAVHVVEAPGVGLDLARGCGRLQARAAQVVRDGAEGGIVLVADKTVPVVVTCRGAGPARVFP